MEINYKGKRVLSVPDLRHKGIGSRATLHRRRQEPDFPAAIVIGGRIGFFEDEIDAYLASRPRRVPRTAAA